jgi:hypothetical protein
MIKKILKFFVFKLLQQATGAQMKPFSSCMRACFQRPLGAGWILPLGLTACLVSFQDIQAVNATTKQAARQLPGAFDIHQAPSQADWQFFLRTPAAKRLELWSYHKSKKLQLKDWAWGWRLGWVRACGDDKNAACSDILSAALQDKALVVRAEAATQIGRLFEDTSNQKAVELLASAYNNPRNLRRGKPLFVQSRILFALSRIGGKKALDAAQSLAKSNPQMQLYWSKLRRSTDAQRG